MHYEMISADCHLDLCWLPPELFTSQASAAMRDRMPHVTQGSKGPVWVTKKGASLGHVNGMGSGGREYVPGRIHRADRMASTGLYEDGKKGIRRLTDPELRGKDQDRDGVQGEVLYGVLGATGRLPDQLGKIVMIGSDPTRAKLPDAPDIPLPVARAAFATNITHFQINMSNIL